MLNHAFYGHLINAHMHPLFVPMVVGVGWSCCETQALFIENTISVSGSSPFYPVSHPPATSRGRKFLLHFLGEKTEALRGK